MELFDELVECDVAIVMPHLLPLIQFCLELASSESLGSNLRVKGLSFVSWLITLKKKVEFCVFVCAHVKESVEVMYVMGIYFVQFVFSFCV